MEFYSENQIKPEIRGDKGVLFAQSGPFGKGYGYTVLNRTGSIERQAIAANSGGAVILAAYDGVRISDEEAERITRNLEDGSTTIEAVTSMFVVQQAVRE